MMKEMLLLVCWVCYVRVRVKFLLYFDVYDYWWVMKKYTKLFNCFTSYIQYVTARWIKTRSTKAPVWSLFIGHKIYQRFLWILHYTKQSYLSIWRQTPSIKYCWYNDTIIHRNVPSIVSKILKDNCRYCPLEYFSNRNKITIFQIS